MKHFLLQELHACEACHEERDDERPMLWPVGGRLEPALAQRVRQVLSRPIVRVFVPGRGWRRVR